MTTTALWTNHRRIAYSVARQYRIPGAGCDDVEQESLIGLWIAARTFRSDRGATFSTFAHLVIHRRLSTLVRLAVSGRHAILTNAAREDGDYVQICGGDEPDRVVIARDLLERIIAATETLTATERDALMRAVNDEPIATKTEDNARWRARRKIREQVAA